MPDQHAPITVLGAGSWGTALALLLADGGCPVRLWDRAPASVERLRSERENARYLPGFPLPEAIEPIADISAAVRGADCVVVAVPSGVIEEILSPLFSHLTPGCDIVLASKGLEPGTGWTPWRVAEEALGQGNFPLIALSGPNLASEVARGIPTAAVAACPAIEYAQRTAARFHRPSFRVYAGTDITGVEIGGALKNVLAIAGGVSDGLGYGDNTKATLLTRGLAEMTRLGVACGAKAETFYGLSGIGDLMATAASRLSRNWRVGEGIAKGETLDAVLARLGQVAEGVPTARAVRVLAGLREVETPVCRAVYRLLFEGLPPKQAVADLLARPAGEEW